jgi:hypothetical protein
MGLISILLGCRRLGRSVDVCVVNWSFLTTIVIDFQAIFPLERATC